MTWERGQVRASLCVCVEGGGGKGGRHLGFGTRLVCLMVLVSQSHNASSTCRVCSSTCRVCMTVSQVVDTLPAVHTGH